MSQTTENTVKSSFRHNFPAYLLSEVDSFARDLAVANEVLTAALADAPVGLFALRIPLPSRFFRHVSQLDNGCWMWTGAVTNGPTGYTHHRYGQIRISNSRRTSAHRFAFLYTFGNIPQGKELDHTCQTKLCVNPNHLELVTHQQNCERRAMRQRRAK